MKLIVGLGNPGKNYEGTRHNFGFEFLDFLADDFNFSFQKSAKFKSEFSEIKNELHQKVFFLKPQTFMNLSGESMQAFMSFYKLTLDDVLVIHDDIDLPFGKIRFVREGSSGGHNGINSIASICGSTNFHRLKLGVGRPKVVHQEVTDYVLQKFNSEETKNLKNIFQTCAETLKIYLADGIQATMNQYN
jgi:PTH1 family peptidyl-tRNA hydrolase